MKNLCIYHKNCADGFGAMLAVKAFWDLQKIPEADREFIPAHYGDTPPEVKDKHVTIVDFSYPRETLLDIYYQAASLLVIDHHKTAKDDLDGLDFCIFDMEQSGAMLTWKYFFSPKEHLFAPDKSSNTPALIQYIQDRDLWAWKLPRSKQVSAALQAIPMTPEEWGPYLDDKNIDELKMQGEAILKYQSRQVNKIVNSALPIIEFCGFDVPCINTTTLVSEIGEALSKHHPFAVMYFDTYGKRVYSLRSQDTGEDVSAIAKRFGGGGHPNAASFSIPHDIVLMCAENPFGYKLENLLAQVAIELEAKNDLLMSKPLTPTIDTLIKNNGKIQEHLMVSIEHQNHSMAALDSLGNNQGPGGKPRV